MPTIDSKVSQKEFDAIVEYANLCDETISNLIRKVLIPEATMLYSSHVEEHLKYKCSIPIPYNILGEEEYRLMEEKINKI